MVQVRRRAHAGMAYDHGADSLRSCWPRTGHLAMQQFDLPAFATPSHKTGSARITMHTGVTGELVCALLRFCVAVPTPPWIRLRHLMMLTMPFTEVLQMLSTGMFPRAPKTMPWFGTYGPPEVLYFDLTVGHKSWPQTAKVVPYIVKKGHR